jgi:hypothetical protein
MSLSVGRGSSGPIETAIRLRVIDAGGTVLDYKAAARLPDRLRFTRNGREAEARRVLVGEIQINGRELRVADVAYGNDAPPLPVRVPDGRHRVYAYDWEHARGPIKVCAVVAFGRQRLAVARPLVISNQMRPDLTDGIIVDHAEVQIGGTSGVTLPSGLGDGYYPVIGVYNFGVSVQAIVLDLKVWQVREVVLLPGQVLDEFGVVRRVIQDSETGR